MSENLKQIIENINNNKNLIAKLAATYARELAKAENPYVLNGWKNWQDCQPVLLATLQEESIQVNSYYDYISFKTPLDELQNFLDSEDKEEFIQKITKRDKKRKLENRIFELNEFLKSNSESEEEVNKRINRIKEMIDNLI